MIDDVAHSTYSRLATGTRRVYGYLEAHRLGRIYPEATEDSGILGNLGADGREKRSPTHEPGHLNEREHLTAIGRERERSSRQINKRQHRNVTSKKSA